MTLRVAEIDATVPQGVNGSAIQVLAPNEATVTSVTIGAANARGALPTGSEIVEVSVEDSCKFAFGDSSIDVSSGTWRVLHKGVYVWRVPPGATHYAVIQLAAQTGVVTVARLL